MYLYTDGVAILVQAQNKIPIANCTAENERRKRKFECENYRQFRVKNNVQRSRDSNNVFQQKTHVSARFSLNERAYK